MKTEPKRPSLRSRAWFDNAGNPDMTALYLERYLNFGLSQEELQSGKPIIGIAQFTGGSGRWAGLTGVAFITGRQNGDGTATLTYNGFVYLPGDTPER